MNFEPMNHPPIIIDPSILDYKLVKRTWSERLFELPWTPWLPKKKVHKTAWIDTPVGYVVSPQTYSLLMGVNGRN